MSRQKQMYMVVCKPKKEFRGVLKAEVAVLNAYSGAEAVRLFEWGSFGALDDRYCKPVATPYAYGRIVTV